MTQKMIAAFPGQWLGTGVGHRLPMTPDQASVHLVTLCNTTATHPCPLHDGTHHVHSDVLIIIIINANHLSTLWPPNYLYLPSCTPVYPCILQNIYLLTSCTTEQKTIPTKICTWFLSTFAQKRLVAWGSTLHVAQCFILACVLCRPVLLVLLTSIVLPTCIEECLVV